MSPAAVSAAVLASRSLPTHRRRESPPGYAASRGSMPAFCSGGRVGAGFGPADQHAPRARAVDDGLAGLVDQHLSGVAAVRGGHHRSRVARAELVGDRAAGVAVGPGRARHRVDRVGRRAAASATPASSAARLRARAASAAGSSACARSGTALDDLTDADQHRAARSRRTPVRSSHAPLRCGDLHRLPVLLGGIGGLRRGSAAKRSADSTGLLDAGSDRGPSGPSTGSPPMPARMVKTAPSAAGLVLVVRTSMRSARVRFIRPVPSRVVGPPRPRDHHGNARGNAHERDLLLERVAARSRPRGSAARKAACMLSQSRAGPGFATRALATGAGGDRKRSPPPAKPSSWRAGAARSHISMRKYA